MKYIVIKTHARNQGFVLYERGKVYEEKEMESVGFKLNKGLIKEYHGPVKTKEEKKRRKTK